MASHQAPPSLGFSRQEHWSGLPSPSPMHESEKWKWKWSRVQLLVTPWTAGPPASSIHGIFQARVLEWVAIAFSYKKTRVRLRVADVKWVERRKPGITCEGPFAHLKCIEYSMYSGHDHDCLRNKLNKEMELYETRRWRKHLGGGEFQESCGSGGNAKQGINLRMISG